MTPWSFLFFSILLHVLIWLLILAGQHAPPKHDNPIEVTIVKKETSPPQSVVRQAEVPKDLLTEKRQKAKYLSERDQSVKEEMKSQNQGLTQNKQSDARKRQAQQKLAAQKEKETKKIEDDGDLYQKKMPTLADLTPDPVAPEVSQNSDVTEKMKIGKMTALNEEHFTYYSFFSRIEERVVPIWERNLKNTQDNMRPQDIKRMADHVFVTEIEVLLDSRGYYVGTIIAKSCGNAEIDNDGVAAFKEASYFPNPPQEMVKEDGRIHLQYTLNYTVFEGLGP